MMTAAHQLIILAMMMVVMTITMMTPMGMMTMMPVSVMDLVTMMIAMVSINDNAIMVIIEIAGLRGLCRQQHRCRRCDC